jgi:hypothetical protein
MILDQRSDVEQFFLEALEQVKEEVRKRKEQNKESSLPELNRSGSRPSNYHPSNNSLFGGSEYYQNLKIRLKDLDWEDRERVLRLLFSKMNSGVPCSNWRNPQANVYASAHDLRDDNSIIQEADDDENMGNMAMIQNSKEQNNIQYTPWQVDD